MFLVVLQVVGDVLAVQQPTILSFLNEPVVNWPLMRNHFGDLACGNVVDELPEGLIAIDQQKATVLSVGGGGDDVSFSHDVCDLPVDGPLSNIHSNEVMKYPGFRS